MQPPDDVHEWLTAAQAAEVIGMSGMGVYKRVKRDAVPYVEHGGRYGFRRDHVELLGNAHSRPPEPKPVAGLVERGLASPETLWVEREEVAPSGSRCCQSRCR